MKLKKILVQLLVISIFSTSLTPLFALDNKALKQTANRVVLSDVQTSRILGTGKQPAPPPPPVVNRVFEITFVNRNSVALGNTDKVKNIKVFEVNSVSNSWREITGCGNGTYTSPAGYYIAKVGWVEGVGTWIEKWNDKQSAADKVVAQSVGL